MSDCRRNFSKEEIIAGLKAGRTFVVDRRDAPELEDLFELEKQGLVIQKMETVGSQGTIVKWIWK